MNVYETFIEGAKDGFNYAVMVMPYQLTILIAVSVFRASGALGLVQQGLESFIVFMGFNTGLAGMIAAIIISHIFFYA